MVRPEDVEEANKLPLTGEPELGLVWPIFKWAKGRHLQEVLSGTDLAAGDFVRWVKQVIDLLDQLAHIPNLYLRDCAGRARRPSNSIKRGVVAYSSVARAAGHAGPLAGPFAGPLSRPAET